MAVGMRMLTPEHVLPLPIQNTRPRLQILPPQPLRQRNRPRIRCPGVYGYLLLLSLLGRIRRLLLSRGGLLLGELLLALVVLKRLLFELVDVLVEAEACLLGIGFELGALDGLELLGRHAAFFGFGGHGGLHGRELLGGRLGGGRGGHCGCHCGEEL